MREVGEKEEQWKETRFRGIYVSSWGRVASTNWKEPRLLTPQLNQSDYVRVALSVPGVGGRPKQQNVSVHQLVCEAFCEKPTSEEELEPDHLNHCPYDNRVRNLWLTTKSNNLLARRSRRDGVETGVSVLPSGQYRVKLELHGTVLVDETVPTLEKANELSVQWQAERLKRIGRPAAPPVADKGILIGWMTEHGWCVRMDPLTWQCYVTCVDVSPHFRVWEGAWPLLQSTDTRYRSGWATMTHYALNIRGDFAALQYPQNLWTHITQNGSRDTKGKTDHATPEPGRDRACPAGGIVLPSEKPGGHRLTVSSDGRVTATVHKEAPGASEGPRDRPSDDRGEGGVAERPGAGKDDAPRA